MATAYERYLKLNIDSSCVGLERGEGKSEYFCTPAGANVIGWAGVDGIHYCFVRDFGQMVFAVSPMSTPGNYVHPVAGDFTDFLRLLLACGDTAALEQVHCWEQAQFDAFLQDNPPTDEQRGVLDYLREKLSLTPMAQPFAYIKELQAGFDYSRIIYTEEYDECVPAEPKIPEWKVYFDGGFLEYHSSEIPGVEITLNRRFVWDNEMWHIPAVYTCSKGLVVDFCAQVSAERIRLFMDKWNLSIGNDRNELTDEQQMRIDAENPLAGHISPKALLNGTILSGAHGRGVTWNPLFLESNSLEARSVLQHYDLDPAYGWVIRRAAFPWTTKRKPLITTLSITMVQWPAALPGAHFHVSSPGERVEFTHPTTGGQHTLTVQEYERQEVSSELFNSQYEQFPTHYTMMSYTLSPELPDGAVNVTDCVRSDMPRQKRTNPKDAHESSACASVGIIGSASGPTAIIVGGGSKQGKLRAACSAPHFEPVDHVEWRMVFYIKKREDIRVELI